MGQRPLGYKPAYAVANTFEPKRNGKRFIAGKIGLFHVKFPNMPALRFMQLWLD